MASAIYTSTPAVAGNAVYASHAMPFNLVWFELPAFLASGRSVASALPMKPSAVHSTDIPPARLLVRLLVHLIQVLAIFLFRNDRL
jgi:hypothetical protein